MSSRPDRGVVHSGRFTFRPVRSNATASGHSVFLDDDLLEGAVAYRTTSQTFVIDAAGPSLPEWLFSISVQDFGSSLDTIRVDFPSEQWPTLTGDAIEPSLRFGFQGSSPVISVDFVYDYLNWAQPWSIADHQEALTNAMRANPDLALMPHPYFGFEDVDALMKKEREPEFSILRGVEANVRLGPLVTTFLEAVEQLLRRSDRLLRATAPASSISEEFRFPAPVRAACQQYLAHFAQFLRDLGIESQTEIQDRGSTVLFRVTPSTGAEALGAIREALDAYLALPTDKEGLQVLAAQPDQSARELHATVLFLQSQLVMAQATNQSLLATNSVLLRSLQSGDQPSRAAERESEEVLPHVSVVPVEGRGLRIDLPGIVRRLRRRPSGESNQGRR